MFFCLVEDDKSRCQMVERDLSLSYVGIHCVLYYSAGYNCITEQVEATTVSKHRKSSWWWSGRKGRIYPVQFGFCQFQPDGAGIFSRVVRARGLGDCK